MKKNTSSKPRVVYRGKIFRIEKRDVILPDGTKDVYEYCVRPSSVTTLAFNDQNELLLIRERRAGKKSFEWFLPTGRIDHPGDTPKKAALRELREEAGYSATTIRLLRKTSHSTTLIWDTYTFVATNIYPSPLPKDAGEYTSAHFMPLKKAVHLALRGKIRNDFIAYTIIRFNEMLRSGEFTW